MQRKVTIKKKLPAKKTTPKKNTPNKAKRTPKKEVATKTNDVDSNSREDKFHWQPDDIEWLDKKRFTPFTLHFSSGIDAFERKEL